MRVVYGTGIAIGKKGDSIEVTLCAFRRFFIKSYSVQIGNTNYDPFLTVLSESSGGGRIHAVLCQVRKVWTNERGWHVSLPQMHPFRLITLEDAEKFYLRQRARENLRRKLPMRSSPFIYKNSKEIDNKQQNAYAYVILFLNIITNLLSNVHRCWFEDMNSIV